MANTVYENTVLESKLTELVDSKIEVRALMSVDKSLEEGAGLTKVINRYTAAVSRLSTAVRRTRTSESLPSPRRSTRSRDISRPSDTTTWRRCRTPR